MTTPNDATKKTTATPHHETPHTTSKVNNPGASGPAVLNFEDVKKIPAASQRAALTNPFQAKVNELAKSGEASSVVVNDDDVEWTRRMIRSACGAIGKGSETKVTPATEKADGSGPKIPGKSRVYFSVPEKRARKTT